MNKLKNIVALRRLVVDYCLGRLGEEELVRKARELGWDGEKLLDLVDRTFRELDREKWHRLLKAHPYAPEAFQTYWKTHGKPRVVSRAEPLSLGEIRDTDIVIWLAKEISHT